MAEIDLDFTPDPCESPLLAPGSDGLVQGDARQVLQQLADYREAGHSMQRIRRDFALAPRVTNSQIKAAAEYGRRLTVAGGDWVAAATRVPERRRYFGGIDRLPTKAEFEDQHRAKAAQTREG